MSNGTTTQMKPKSMAVAVVLTIFFSCLGLFYASVTGGIVMTIAVIVSIIIAVLTLGLGSPLVIICYIISIIWAIVSVNKRNKALMGPSPGANQPPQTP